MFVKWVAECRQQVYEVWEGAVDEDVFHVQKDDENQGGGQEAVAEHQTNRGQEKTKE